MKKRLLSDEWMSSSIKLAGPLRIPSKKRLINRSYECMIALPKMFLSAFLWEGFGLASGYSSETVRYYFITGLGGGVGVLVGHMIVFYFARGKDFVFKEELTKAALYGMAVFLGPATLWQKIVNEADEWGWTFTGSFFFMWLVASLVYFTSMSVFRLFAEFGSCYFPILKTVEPAKQRMVSDFSLSFSVGLGDAFFMGTCGDQFSHNWLAPAFGVHDSTNAMEAMVKSGTSVMTGFLLMQVFENIAFGSVWTDDATDEEPDTSKAPASISISMTEQALKAAALEQGPPTANPINT